MAAPAGLSLQSSTLSGRGGETISLKRDSLEYDINGDRVNQR